jgi:Fe2+ or Zn2+ uptake regulation protein
VKTWKPHPLYVTIVEILEKKGPLTDMELFDALKESYEYIGFGDVNRTLMAMEINGKIYVSSLARGRRRVELVKARV